MFADSEIAQDILRKRYFSSGENSSGQLLDRVARAVASVEDDESFSFYFQEFYAIMEHGIFLPNSPCLVNAGRGGGLFACFVLGMEDNLESISAAKADAMAITKSGGGWGIGLSELRPSGSRVRGSTHGIAGGPVGFWSTFSSDMRVMTQGGFRDAACMATMRVDHPDILDFIRSKSPINSIIKLLNLDRLSNDPEPIARRLLEQGTLAAAAETYMSNFNVSVLASDEFMSAAISGKRSLKTTFAGKEFGTIDPTELLEEIAHGAWQNGEPGLLYIDTIKRRTKYDPDLIMATNPCGEQPLPPNGSCCLGSINVSGLVRDGGIDMGDLRDATRTAVRFLDNLITINVFPTEETRAWSLHNRSIGIGVMGFADALIKIGIRYDSADAVNMASVIAGVIRTTAEEASKELQEERGRYDGFGGPFDGRRNNAVMSIAPTGTISLLAGCSPGIEPIFSSEFLRRDETGDHVVTHPLSGMGAFVTVMEMDWRAIVDIVAAFSTYVDTSVSYTVNLPNDSTVSDVIDVYKYAWEKRCNGCTVYRDGSRQRQVLNAESQNQAVALKRPVSLSGMTYKYSGHVDGTNTNLYITVNDLDGEPFEVFANTPHIKALTELQLVTAVTRLTSMALRHGAPVEKIIQQLRKIEGQSLISIPALIARALESHIGHSGGACPECGGDLLHNGGCNVCTECGYSHCG